MKKHGFTLIELLGVIVILSVIALITVPMVVGVIEKTKKNSLKSSAYGILESATLYYAEYQNPKTVRFDIENNQIVSEEANLLSYKGTIKKGTILINQKGEVTICMNDGAYAAYKNYRDQEITIINQKTCTVPESNYIVYLDGESTITELTNQELTAKIEELEQKIMELENNKTNIVETTELSKKHDADVNTLTTNLNTNIATINNRLNSITNNITFLNNTVNSKEEKNYIDFSKMVDVVGTANTNYIPSENGYIIFKYRVEDEDYSSNMGMTGYIDGVPVFRYSDFHQAGAINDIISAPYKVNAGQTIYFDVISNGATQYGTISFIPLKYYE